MAHLGVQLSGIEMQLNFVSSPGAAFNWLLSESSRQGNRLNAALPCCPFAVPAGLLEGSRSQLNWEFVASPPWGFGTRRLQPNRTAGPQSGKKANQSIEQRCGFPQIR